MVHAKKINLIKSASRAAPRRHRARISIRKHREIIDPALLFALRLPALVAIERLVEAQLLHPTAIIFSEKYEMLDEIEYRKIIDDFREAELCRLLNESAKKWWDAFIDENQQRPKLVVQLIKELEERKCNLSDFFITYVYANTDNIQAQLFLQDFTRSEHGQIKEEKLSKLKSHVLARFVTELKACFQLDKKTDPLCASWFGKFSAQSKKWSREDIMSILYFISKRTTLRQLVYLSSLAQSLKPLSLLYFYKALSHNKESTWCTLYSQAGQGALSKFKRVESKELSYYDLFCVIQAHFLKSIGINTRIKSVQFDLVEPALKDTLTKLKEKFSIVLINSFSYSDTDTHKSAVRTAAALKWTIYEGEIEDILNSRKTRARSKKLSR